MVTSADLIAMYPEFAGVDPDQIEAHLLRAAPRVDPEVLRCSTDLAIILTACHTLASSPMGQNARLKSKDQDASTTYGRELASLMLECSQGYRITL